MERTKVNNSFYEELKEKWHEERSHPIALLRAENAVRNPWILNTVESLLGKKTSILDIGCGGGLLTNCLAKAGHTVTGVDLSPSSLSIAKQYDKTGSVTYLQADATRIPLEGGCFDVVCAMDLLEHVENPSLVIQEASRLLKKGGLFFFHTFNRNWLSYLLVIKGVEWFVKNTPPNMHVYSLFIKPEELVAFCLQNHLHVESMQGLVPSFTVKSFCQMLIYKTVDKDFSFAFSSSLKTGYVGFARKVYSRLVI